MPNEQGHITKATRAGDCDEYWYIDDRFIVRRTCDEHERADEERFLAGNYFNSREDAVEFLRLALDNVK